MKCPNNNNHNLRPSEYSPDTYVCDDCLGFSAWHKDDLAPEDSPHVFNINDLFNKKLEEEFDMPLAFSFRVEEENSRYIIQAYSIVTGNKIGTKDIHLSTFRIITRIKKDIENHFGLELFWA